MKRFIWAKGVAAPYCGMLLALYGAEVIKLEPPEAIGRAVLARSMAITPPCQPSTFGQSLSMRRFEDHAGRRIARALARRADVLIEWFRPGVLTRMELGCDSTSQENPALIYVSVSGFGQNWALRHAALFRCGCASIHWFGFSQRRQ
jgi:crotonobetainyl-CoA:carnitine CoA-transferase CaiB-like acyl-CoA transferase